MTITNTNIEVTYPGNGIVTEWPFEFLVYEPDELVVSVKRLVDSEWTVVPPIEYTVLGLGTESGTVVYLPSSGPLAADHELRIRRQPRYSQTEIDLGFSSGFSPELIEKEFDRALMRSLDLLNIAVGGEGISSDVVHTAGDPRWLKLDGSNIASYAATLRTALALGSAAVEPASAFASPDEATVIAAGLMPASDKEKLDYLTVTSAADINQLVTDVAALSGGSVFKGNWDASSGSFPGSGTAQTGHFWYVEVSGTVDSVAFSAGDTITAITDDASTTTFAGNWARQASVSAVQSVISLTGAISQADLRTALGLGDAAYTSTSAYAAAVHTHSYTELTDKPTLGTMAPLATGTGGTEFRNNSQNDGRFARLAADNIYTGRATLSITGEVGQWFPVIQRDEITVGGLWSSATLDFAIHGGSWDHLLYQNDGRWYQGDGATDANLRLMREEDSDARYLRLNGDNVGSSAADLRAAFELGTMAVLNSGTAGTQFRNNTENDGRFAQLSAFNVFTQGQIVRDGTPFYRLEESDGNPAYNRFEMRLDANSFRLVTSNDSGFVSLDLLAPLGVSGVTSWEFRVNNVQAALIEAAGPTITDPQAVITKEKGDARYATTAQGALADTAVQPGDLATVAATGQYADIINRPILGTMAELAAGTGDAQFRTNAQNDGRFKRKKLWNLADDLALDGSDEGAAANALFTAIRAESYGQYVEVDLEGGNLGTTQQLQFDALQVANGKISALGTTGTWGAGTAVAAFSSGFNGCAEDIWIECNHVARCALFSNREGGQRLQNVRGTRFTEKGLWLQGSVHADNCNFEQFQDDAGANAAGPWDAASGSFPSGASDNAVYYVTGPGTVNGVSFAVGDALIAQVDSPSTTVYAGNWLKGKTDYSRGSIFANRTAYCYYLEGAVTDSRFTHCLGSRSLVPLYIHHNAHHVFFDTCHFYQGYNASQGAPWQGNSDSPTGDVWIARILGFDVNFSDMYFDLGKVFYHVNTNSPGPGVWMTIDGIRSVANDSIADFGEWVEIYTDRANTRLDHLKITPASSWKYGTSTTGLVKLSTGGSGSFTAWAGGLTGIQHDLMTTQAGLNLYSGDANTRQALNLIGSASSSVGMEMRHRGMTGAGVEIAAFDNDFAIVLDAVERMRLYNDNGVLNTAGGFGVGGIEVLTGQGAAVADATSEADAVTKLNALLAQLRSIGIIAT